MNNPNDSPLSANQQAMLDLALACDLKVSNPSEHEAIKAHHARITTQGEAAVYIKSVEYKVHSRRRVRVLPSRRKQALPNPLKAYTVRKKGSNLDAEFVGQYFMLVVGQYTTMSAKANDPAAQAEAESIVKVDPAEISWEDVYRLELAMLKLEPLEGLCRKAWILRQEYAEVASADENTKYAASKPPSADDPATADEKLLRADLVKIQEELNWYYTVLWIQEEFRSRLNSDIIYLTIGCTFLFILLAAIFYYNQSSSLQMLATVIYSGIIGGAISTVRRVQSTNMSGNADLTLLELERGKSSVYMSPFLGGVFALVLFCLMAGAFMQGSFFPTFKAGGRTLFECDLAGYADHAKLVVWSFVAGFAEQFVPDRLDQLAKQASDNAGTKKS